MKTAKTYFVVACECVLERFKLKRPKQIQRKELEKLANAKNVFVIQPTGSGLSVIVKF